MKNTAFLYFRKMKGNFRICFFILLISATVYNCRPKLEPKIESQKNSIAEQFDSLKKSKHSLVIKKTRLKKLSQEVEKEQNDSLFFRMLYYKGYLLYFEKKYDSVMHYSKKLLKLVSEENDAQLLGKVYFMKGLCHSHKHDSDSAYFYYEKSKQVYLKLNDSLEVGKRLLNMANIESLHDDFVQSDYSCIEGLKYLGNKHNGFRASLYNSLAISAKHQREYKEALKYYDEALSLTNSELSKAVYLQNKAIVYGLLGKNEIAEEIWSNLLKDTLLLDKDLKLKARIIDNHAFLNWTNNKNLNVLERFQKAVEIRLKGNNKVGLLASYTHLSDYYKNINKRKAIKYARKRFELASELKSPKSKLKALDQLIELDEPNRVNADYKEYIHLSDSLLRVSQKAKNRFAKIRYHSVQNSKEALLYKSKSIEKELELEIEKNKRNVLIGIALLLIGVFLFIIRVKIQNHKKEKVFEVYKTEKRISEKIHDELSNDVFSIMNELQFSKINISSILDKLEDLYKRTRNISHENSSVNLGEGFENSLKELLSSYINSSCQVIIKDIKTVELNSLVTSKQIVLYRILQELMVNMKKHSQANLVVLSFAKKSSNIEINYADNGVACDLSEIKNKNGLQNMETRIKSIHGIISFDSKPNKGFKVKIKFKN